MTDLRISARVMPMHELHHEHTPDIDAFLQATQKAVDLDYEYVVKKVGIDSFMRDIDSKKMARMAISLLNEAGLEAFSELSERPLATNEQGLTL